MSERLGPDHPDTLASRIDLAVAYRSGGDLGRAIPLLEQTLTDYERVLGADHPDTLASRINLTGADESGGDLGRAIPLYQQTLTDYERVLGPDHPDTLTSRNNLAHARRLDPGEGSVARESFGGDPAPVVAEPPVKPLPEHWSRSVSRAAEAFGDWDRRASTARPGALKL